MKTLQRGATGPEVKYLQERLSGKGYALSVDGSFGPGTERAVEQFQAAHALTVDGIVGPQSWGLLLSEGQATPPKELRTSASEEYIAKARTQLPLTYGAFTPSQVESILATALQDLGAKEIPDGSNWGAEIHHLVAGYNEYWRVATSKHGRMAWCAMAASTWIGLGLGLGTKSEDMAWGKHPFKSFIGGTTQLAKWATRHGVYVTVDAHGSKPVLPGTVFLMGRYKSGSDTDEVTTTKSSHTGIIVHDDGEYVRTIEGNVSNGVKSYRRKKSDLRAFVEWWHAKAS